MRTAYHESDDPGGRPPWWRRLSGLLFALAMEGIIILLLVLSGQRLILGGRREQSLKTFTVSERPQLAEAPAKQTKQKRKRTVTRTQPTPPRQPPPVPPTPLGPIPGMINLTQQEYRRADIGKIRSAPAEVAATDGDSDSTSDDSVASGRAPNGEPLFNAEWYREPTDAELAFYLPKGVRSGAAEIACKTAPRYRVEDCVILGDLPPGTGLARGLREAAWQFRVRPPRKGGNDLIGAWVRIHFDLIERTR